MIKLGTKVRVIRGTSWYEDVGESIGIIVAVPQRKTAESIYKIMFPKETFLGDYGVLHSCSSQKGYEFDMRYFRIKDNDSIFPYVLKKEYRGYEIKLRDLVEVKKGNSELFR